MEVQVNGKKIQVSDGTTAAGLLHQLGIEPERVVVEVNLNIVKRAQLASVTLQPGDQVEIVHFVGGGSCRRKTQDARHTSWVLSPES